MATFQDWVVSDYNASRSKQYIPIQEYVDLVVKHRPGVYPDEIYEPIIVKLQLSDHDCVPIQVEYSPSWYSQIQQGVSHMTKIKPSEVVLKDVTNTDIRNQITDAHDLAHIGKIRVFNGNTRVNLPSLPEPPAHMSGDTLEHLNNWYEKDMKSALVSAIVTELKDAKDELDLHTRTNQNSPLDLKLQDIVKTKCIGGDLSSFVKTYGSTHRAKTTPAVDVAQNIATSMLRQTRQVMGGAERRLKRHLGAKLAANLKQNSDGHIFSSTAAQVGEGMEDEHKMYSELARKAVRLNKLEVINHVYRAQPIKCGCDKKEDEESYYDNYGYSQDTYDRVQKFLGNAVFMAPALPKAVSKLPKAPGKPFESVKEPSNVSFTQETYDKVQKIREKPVYMAPNVVKSSTGSPLRGARLRDALKEDPAPVGKFVPFPKVVEREMPALRKKTGIDTQKPIGKFVPFPKDEKEMSDKPWPGIKERIDSSKKVEKPFPGVVSSKKVELVPIGSPVYAAEPINDGMPDINYYLKKRQQNQKK